MPARTGPGAASRTVAELEQQLSEAHAEIGALELQLAILSTMDPVSGLPNVQGTIAALGDTVARARRTGEPYGLMMVRIPALDAVRRFQDYGAYCETVRHTAALVVAALRRIDRVGRLEPGAFVALLPGLTAADVEAVTDRLAMLLGSVEITFPTGAARKIHAEIAVLTADRNTTDQVPLLLDALYEAAEAAAHGAPIVADAPGTVMPFDRSRR